jgi:hypothetical protein
MEKQTISYYVGKTLKVKTKEIEFKEIKNVKCFTLPIRSTIMLK